MTAQTLIRSTLVAFLIFATSLAEERPLPAVVYTGQTAGGTALPFLTLDGAPVINGQGDVAFRAIVGTVQAMTRGLWRASVATGRVEAVALQGLPAPMPGQSKFVSFGLPFLLAGGDVLFAADAQGTSLFDAVFLASSIDEVSLAVAVSALGASTRIDGIALSDGGLVAVLTDRGIFKGRPTAAFDLVCALGGDAPGAPGAAFATLGELGAYTVRLKGAADCETARADSLVTLIEAWGQITHPKRRWWPFKLPDG